MPQSITQLPMYADFKILRYHFTIRYHKVREVERLFGNIMWIIVDTNSDGQTLRQFEKHGISFETMIEECARELEHDVGVLAWFICLNHNADTIRGPNILENKWSACLNFSKSDAGRNIADQFIEKIRSCDNWDQLYEEIHPQNIFCKNMEKRIIMELKQCHKV